MDAAARQQDLQATAVRPAVSGYALVGVNDPVRGKVYPLTGKVVIGRDEQCDIIVDSPLVSRRHAAIEITDRGVRLHDLNSSNGTFVADEKVNDCLLAPGDEVRFDEVRFVLQGPPEDLASTRLRPAATEAPATGLMSGHEDITRTSMTPVVRTPRPWLWGLGSFVLVAALMAIAYLLR